jgi:hypothetical protein
MKIQTTETDNENELIINDDIFHPYPTKHSCQGCWFYNYIDYECYCNLDCIEGIKCHPTQRKDGRNIIWKLKEPMLKK